MEGGASPLEMERVTEKNKKLSTDDDNEFDSAKKAAGIVSHVLIVNAWRRRREDAVELNNTIEKLSQQVDHLQLQIVVLRRLLTTENNRVGKLGSEVHRTKIQLENMTKQKDTITEVISSGEDKDLFLFLLAHEIHKINHFFFFFISISHFSFFFFFFSC